MLKKEQGLSREHAKRMAARGGRKPSFMTMALDSTGKENLTLATEEPPRETGVEFETTLFEESGRSPSKGSKAPKLKKTAKIMVDGKPVSAKSPLVVATS